MSNENQITTVSQFKFTPEAEALLKSRNKWWSKKALNKQTVVTDDDLILLNRNLYRRPGCNQLDPTWR